MSLQIPTNPTEAADAVGKITENFSGNSNRMLIGIMIAYLISIIFLVVQFSTDIKQQRSEFLQQIDRNTERTMNSFDKNTEALRHFQEVLQQK